MKLDHGKILEMLNNRATMQEIVDAVNPGRKRQTMDEYVHKHFECTVKWRAKRVKK